MHEQMEHPLRFPNSPCHVSPPSQRKMGLGEGPSRWFAARRMPSDKTEGTWGADPGISPSVSGAWHAAQIPLSGRCVPNPSAGSSKT